MASRAGLCSAAVPISTTTSSRISSKSTSPVLAPVPLQLRQSAACKRQSAGQASWALPPRGRPMRASPVVAAATADSGNTPKPSSAEKVTALASAFWKFLRPHTIRGTILATTMVVTRALMANPEAINWDLVPRALCGLVALLCGNGYIVGINQIYDVDIDTVNKPFLPMAAGELGPKTAWAMIIGLAALGLTIVTTLFDPLIASLYTFGLFLGTIYSVPPLRLKQFAVPAFMIIATVRGFLLNFGVYHATRAAIGLQFHWSPAIMFITAFATMFAVVIAITKDLPDVAGDKQFGIETFATRLGVQNLSLAAIGLLLSSYAGAIYTAFTMGSAFNLPVMAGAHAVMALVLIFRAFKLHSDKYDQKAIQNFYRWIWNLFYAEYALLPFI